MRLSADALWKIYLNRLWKWLFNTNTINKSINAVIRNGAALPVDLAIVIIYTYDIFMSNNKTTAIAAFRFRSFASGLYLLSFTRKLTNEETRNQQSNNPTNFIKYLHN